MIGVVVLNYNSAADCRKCVSFLKRQNNVALDIIVVDNNSSLIDRHDVMQLCREESLTFLPVAENLGYNAGNNVGLRYCAQQGYDYALIVNPDMEFPDANYITSLVDAISQNSDYVVAASDIVTPAGVHQNPMFGDGSWTSAFGWMKSFFRRNTHQDSYSFIDDYKNTHECAKVSGCALLVKMSFIKEIGYFDEYPFLYCEEAILAKQVEQFGKKMIYTTKTAAVHRHIKNEKGDPRPRFRQWRRSRIYYNTRYSGYPWYGRMLANISWRLYMGILIAISTLKRKQ